MFYPKVLVRLSCIALLPLLLISSGYSQATTSLGGHVSDRSGAIIPGASLELRLIATGATRTSTTNDSGEFQFSQLSPGRYDLMVSAPGFATTKRSGLDLLVSQPETINVILAVANVTEQVTV